MKWLVTMGHVSPHEAICWIVEAENGKAAIQRALEAFEPGKLRAFSVAVERVQSPDLPATSPPG